MEVPICDYSLELVASRPAEQGEDLTLHRFPSGSNGFTSDQKTAACVVPGTQMTMEMPEDIQLLFGVTNEELVTFCKMGSSYDTPVGVRPVYNWANAYKDAVQLSNGAKVLLQWFEPGVKARVVVLAGGKEDAELASTVSAPRPVEYVD